MSDHPEWHISRPNQSHEHISYCFYWNSIWHHPFDLTICGTRKAFMPCSLPSHPFFSASIPGVPHRQVKSDSIDFETTVCGDPQRLHWFHLIPIGCQRHSVFAWRRAETDRRSERRCTWCGSHVFGTCRRIWCICLSYKLYSSREVGSRRCCDSRVESLFVNRNR